MLTFQQQKSKTWKQFPRIKTILTLNENFPMVLKQLLLSKSSVNFTFGKKISLICTTTAGDAGYATVDLVNTSQTFYIIYANIYLVYIKSL